MPTATHDTQEALLGLRLMTLLHKQQKSVYALAKQAGVPVHTVQRICKGEGKQPSVWTIAALARVLGVSMDGLVGLNQEAQAAPSSATPQKEAHTTPPPRAKARRPRPVA